MSIANELSSEVAAAVFTSEDVEKSAKLLSALLLFQDTLRALSKDERRRRLLKILPIEPFPSHSIAAAKNARARPEN